MRQTNLFSLVKAAITTRQAADYYGLKVSPNGMTCCPFHQDKHPSMKVDERYYCFGCHQTGDVIHFTAGLFHISQYEAAKKLAADFHIDISAYECPARKKDKLHFIPFKPNLTELADRLESIKTEEARMIQGKWFQYAADVLTEYRLLIHEWMEQYAPQTGAEVWHPRFTEACTQAETVDYLFSLLDDPLEQDFFFHEYHEEVKRINDRTMQYRTAFAV